MRGYKYIWFFKVRHCYQREGGKGYEMDIMGDGFKYIATGNAASSYSLAR